MITELSPKFDTVMIIDDNTIDSYIISRMIIQNNFAKNVLLYIEAEDAMNYLRDNQENISKLPQVIFVDIYMPLMSGFEFMEAYDNLSVTLKNHCKTFIISSTIDDEDIANSNSDKNVVSFHVKPITKEFLDRII